jgi:pimeloyl-ACP methyl ester carboxylesterase
MATYASPIDMNTRYAVDRTHIVDIEPVLEPAGNGKSLKSQRAPPHHWNEALPRGVNPYIPIRQQTLIVAGTEDPIVPVANAHIMNRLLPHAGVHLHNGGHIDLVTNAAELVPVIATFLRTPGEP